MNHPVSLTVSKYAFARETLAVKCGNVKGLQPFVMESQLAALGANLVTIVTLETSSNPPYFLVSETSRKVVILGKWPFRNGNGTF